MLLLRSGSSDDEGFMVQYGCPINILHQHVEQQGVVMDLSRSRSQNIERNMMLSCAGGSHNDVPLTYLHIELEVRLDAQINPEQ